MKHAKFAKLAKMFLGIATISFLNVACQGNMQTGISATESSLEDTAPLSTPEDVAEKVDLKAMESNLVSLKGSVTDITSQLGLFSNADGSIKLWSLLTSGLSNGPLGLLNISGALTEMFDKVILAVQEAKTKFSEARAKLAIEATKLDVANPAHQPILAEIQRMMGLIDQAESKYSVTIKSLASKITLVNKGISTLVAGVSASNPIVGFILPLLTGQVQTALSDFQSKLMAL